MAEAFTSFTLSNIRVPSPSMPPKRHSNRLDLGWLCTEAKATRGRRGSLCKAVPFEDVPLMAVMVQQIEGMRDIVTEKHVWHLSDQAIKNVYMFYIMFTCWGCLFFGSTKDPFYDSEAYRGDGGDGTGFWVYETQEDIEEKARAELWREELIEEIEQNVGGLRELEEAGKK
ncbi:PREDICTED: photosynthetic NDH subunit of subcomplex B 4, chloroplastic isoform X2 [Tarenaya hassleriana]|uniref:photosynthetic NDH subunit of subcomplex B 4, chloroplastic isoform X2 n=1 Tax=Tarenaya hassleriana TaxID=28532 RepID=UPI00053C3882|nr:PREDICTED: photosynthetic NDH subunit of subcomplex B 4, chloroplastic isoform X2 [Tarenaya hassleriana]